MIIDIAEERLLVVSDLHLGNPASKGGESFRAFLDYVRTEDYSLCLNGDAFEMLQTRFSRLIREALPLLTQLGRLRREGRRVYYVVGNHDIYVEHFLDEWLGAAVSPFLNVSTGGKRVRIEHGHLYDPIFSRFPSFYEAATRWSAPLLFLRPDVYRLWDSAAKHLDRRRRSHEDEEYALHYYDAAQEVLRRGFDAVIYGHTHREELRQLGGGLFVNSGTWMRGTYVEISNGDVELKTWAPST